MPPANFRPVDDLDGCYVWLGPSGGAGYLDSKWDSLIGADATVMRVQEHEPLGAIGGTIGASRWTARGGGRAWLEAVAGTRLLDRTMVGASLGSVVEMSDTTHPRFGASVGVWAFFGVTPYVRVGVVDTDGAFVEVGLHIALPVYRW